MDPTRLEDGPAVSAARALATIAGVGCVAFVLSPAQCGALALALGVCALGSARWRLAAIETVAALTFMMIMFGPAGAGGLALMQALMHAPVAAAVRGARPVVALTAATAIATALAVVASTTLVDVVPTRWAPFASMAPAFALAAPALALRWMAASVLGRATAESQRLHALGPLLVALVVGSGAGGLQGAAVGWAAAQLAIPLAMLLHADRRARLAPLALGVLAAGFVAVLAGDAALALARPSSLAAAPAVALELIVFVLALRVHAPAAAQRLARAAGRHSPFGPAAQVQPRARASQRVHYQF